MLSVAKHLPSIAILVLMRGTAGSLVPAGPRPHHAAMTGERSESRAATLADATVIGLHALLLAAALVVPAFAIGDALAALADPAAGEDLRALLNAGRWAALLGNTALVAGVAVLVATAVGGTLALLATRTDLPGHRLLTGAALFGACVPVYVSTAFFLTLIAADRMRGSALACGVLYGLIYTPLAGLVLGVAFRTADRELEEHALLEGPPWRVLCRITIPQAGWAFVAIGTLLLLLVATDFTIPDLLVVRTFAEECYTQYQLDHRRAGPLLTALPVLLVLSLVLVAVQLRYRFLGEKTVWDLGRPALRYGLGRWRPAAGGLVGLLLLAALVVPCLVLVGRARAAPDLLKAVRDAQPPLVTSALLAALAATLVVLPAVGLAACLVRGGRLRWLVGAAVVVLLAVPAPVVGISLIAILNRPGPLGWLHDGPGATVVGYYVRFLPIGVLLLLPAVQRISREIEAAARLDGSGWARLTWHIRWPAVWPDALLAWLVIVILCFTEVGASVLVQAPGWAPAAVVAFQELHMGVYADLAVLALLSIPYVLVPWGLAVWVLRMLLRRRANSASDGGVA